jgi:EAL domain-containing protein (putative c-di-GMP-specific phosphodiesterase class I)
LATSGLNPKLLCLDVPEAGAAVSLSPLRAAGVSLALDEVGASPLALQALAGAPFDSLRVHRSVLDSADLLRATSAIGTALGMSVTVPSEAPAALEHLPSLQEATFAQRVA